jgi:type 1 fimbriae regulatory protein FimB
MTSTKQKPKRDREYLTEGEIKKLLAAARGGATRNPERDYAILLLSYHHGLRVSELCGLKLNDAGLTEGVLHVRRLKDNNSGCHPLYKADRQAIKDWLKVRAEMKPSHGFLFTSERRLKLNRATVWEMVKTVAEAAGLTHLKVHPHSLRHATGYNLINNDVDVRTVQGFLGHRSIQTTTRYTQLAPNRFSGLF